MTSRFYGSLVSPANSAADKDIAPKISIGWWLVPSLNSCLAMISILR